MNELLPLQFFAKCPDARDVLEVRLEAEGHPLILFVNHWKSRASDLGAEQTRRFNAKTVRDRLDQIFLADPAADVIVTGDFNSQYKQTAAHPYMGKTGLNDILGSQGDEKLTATATNFSLYNLWHELPEESQRRSDHFNGKWGTLMQIMLTPGLYDYKGIQYVDNSFRVVALKGVNAVTSLSLPRRWSNMDGGSGTSDHFPVAATFRTVGDGDSAKRLVLESPGTPAPDGDLVPVFAGLNPSELPEFTPQIADDTEKNRGEIFRVKGTISSKKPLQIEVHGREYSLWTSDKDSPALKPVRKLEKGAAVEVIGILGDHKGRNQFLVEDPAWVLKAGA